MTRSHGSGGNDRAAIDGRYGHSRIVNDAVDNHLGHRRLNRHPIGSHRSHFPRQLFFPRQTRLGRKNAQCVHLHR
jgi:hypothetical protein